MRLAALVVLAACSSSPSAPPPPRNSVPAAPSDGATPAAPPIARLTADGIGALTGDVPFHVEAVEKALPALTWAWIDGKPPGPNPPHIVGSLGGAPAVVLGGFRFVEQIHVVSPRIANHLVPVGSPVAALAGKVDPRACHASFDLSDSVGMPGLGCNLPGGQVLLDGDPDVPPAGSPDRLADRRVIGVAISVSPGDATLAALGRRTPRPRDPAVEKSPLLIELGAIHPVTGLAKVTAASLAAALPGMDIAATADGFTVSRGGARVLAITVVGGAPARVEAFHPSISTKLGIGIDETFAEAAGRASGSVADLASQLLLLCASDATRLAATCALSESPRIELAVAASVAMPRHFSHPMMLDDAWVASIIWTAPRTPSRWPAIENDRIGALTPEIARSGFPVVVRAAFRDFDLVGKKDAGFVGFDGFAGKTRVFSFEGGKITILDRRFRLAGIGVGSTMREAEAAGLGPFGCSPPDGGFRTKDSCETKLPRVRLDFGTAGNALAGPALLARRIAAIVWTVDSTLPP